MKLRSLSRKEQMIYVASELNIDITNINTRSLLKNLYEQNISDPDIDRIIGELYIEGRTIRQQNEGDLISELYQVEVFDWGGLYQNSLGKTIVNSYVKKITSYDNLMNSIDNELHTSLKGYVT